MSYRIVGSALVLAGAIAAAPASAAPVDDFEAAYAAAVAHEKDAAANKNQWPATKDALAAARKAADAHDYAKALNLAKRADGLAQASLYQSRTEATAWKDAVIP